MKYLLPITGCMAAVLLLTSAPFAHVGVQGKATAAELTILAVLLAGGVVGFASSLIAAAEFGAKLARSRSPHDAPQNPAPPEAD